MNKFISIISMQFLIAGSTMASTAMLTRSQYDTVRLSTQTLHTINKTSKPGLYLTCGAEDAPKLQIEKLAFLLHSRKNLVKVWLSDFKVAVDQFSLLITYLDKLRLDSKICTPIEVTCNSEQLKALNPRAIEDYNSRKMTFSNCIH